jgi:hypothetical protein
MPTTKKSKFRIFISYFIFPMFITVSHKDLALRYELICIFVFINSNLNSHFQSFRDVCVKIAKISLG